MPNRISLQEMAERLNVSAKTLKKHVETDEIPHILIGRNMRFYAHEVEAHLAARTLERSARATIKEFPVMRKPRRKSIISIKFAKA